MTGGEQDRTDGLAGELALVRARLAEVDHRIKNDLQLIASVFILQMRRMPEGPERDLVRGALDRIGAVSAVHRRLDVTADPKRFEASALVGEVAQEAVAATRRDDVRLDLDLSRAEIPTRQAAPLALIVGELVRNGLKHGLAGRAGVVSVAFGPQDGAVRLAVRDDGAGLAEGETAPKGFGATLAALLAQQLRGQLDFSDAAPGLRAELSFPAET